MVKSEGEEKGKGRLVILSLCEIGLRFAPKIWLADKDKVAHAACQVCPAVCAILLVLP